MNEFNSEVTALLKEIVATQKEQDAIIQAYAAAVHSMLQHAPNLEVIANDFMQRMDSYASVSRNDRIAEVSEHWQRVLNAMTEELNRRKSASNQ